MARSFLKSVKNIILLKHVMQSIDSDDIIGRQRFLLFRWLTFFNTFVVIAVIVEVNLTVVSPLSFLLVILAVLIPVNYFMLGRHRNTKLAYILLISLLIVEIHLDSYYAGGVSNDAMYYNLVAILGAFMLLGTRIGFTFFFIALANQIYFYFIGENTSWVTDYLAEAGPAAMHLDYLIVGGITLTAAAFMLRSFEESKNIVLNNLNSSRIQLRQKNDKLEESEANLTKYLQEVQLKNEELKQMNNDLDKFAYIVSHDLKAPLRAVSTMTEFLKEEAEGKLSPETYSYLEIMRGRVNKMDKLISDILSYSKATRGNKTFAEFKFNYLVQETIDLIMLPDHCTIKVDGGESLVITDKTRLGQIILNLMVNAIKHHTGRTIEIHISLTDKIDTWHFAVKDNGPGISKEHHERIFQIFQRLTKKEDSESTGIGLAIVKKIIEDLHGEIWVQSEPGKGTTFHFSLPKESLKTVQPELARASN